MLALSVIVALLASASAAPVQPPPIVGFQSYMKTRHPISPHVYGVNFATQRLLDLGVTNRQSGDAASKYNWQLDMTNSADDYFWMNSKPYMPNQPATPANSSFIDGMLTRTVKANSVLINPVNALGFVVNSTDECYSFPVSVYGTQQQSHGDAGNGILANGTYLSGDWRCFKPYGVADNVGWFKHLIDLVGLDTLTSHLWLQTSDNEPDCFEPVHRDVHPLPFGYDELWSSVTSWGSLVKQLLSNGVQSVHTNGPSWSNFCWWYWVRGDGCGGTNGVDYKQHGSEFVMPWLMNRMDQYFVATGVKLLDSVDMHYYPSSVPSSDDTPEQQRAILDQVRSLYDWQYTDPGFIGECGAACMGPAIALLPRFTGELKQFAPHMNLSLTVSEYAFGFNDSVYTAALATTEALALFGQWNVLMSARWISPAEGSKVEQAFNVFLNYDGKGARIEGDAIHVETNDGAFFPNQTSYTVYDNNSQTLYSLLFNRDLDQLFAFDIQINDASFTNNLQYETCLVYNMTPDNWELQPREKITVVNNDFESTLYFDLPVPPRGFALVVIPNVAPKTNEYTLWEPSSGPSFDERFEMLLDHEAKLGELSIENKHRYGNAGLEQRAEKMSWMKQIVKAQSAGQRMVSE